MQICPMGQPQEAEPPDVVEMTSSGPWPETEINTTSGDEAMLVYTESKMIEVVELENKLHSQQCFFNFHKYSETISSGRAY